MFVISCQALNNCYSLKFKSSITTQELAMYMLLIYLPVIKVILYNKSNFSRILIGSFDLEDRRIDDVINICFYLSVI